MPIKIPNDLPASKILKEENIFVMDETRALSQRIRPLKLIVVNIMPTKIVTETQLLRLLSNTPLQIEVDWLCMESHNSKNTPQEHLMEFYKTFNEIKDNKYDGLIVTGAPVEKLKFEAQFQKLSPGGAISYVEVPNMQQNLDAVLSVMQYIYDNIMYAELNTKSDFCQVCGYTGEIQIVEEDGKLIWECPNCGNHDQDKMNVARRTCGYIGTQFWNQGRTQEIKERVLHL